MTQAARFRKIYPSSKRPLIWIRSRRSAAPASLKWVDPLSPEQQRRVADELKRFERTPFVITVFNDPEVLQLVSEIESALVLAGWVEIPWNEGNVVDRRTDKPAIGFNFLTGLFVQADESRVSLGVAAAALANALKSEGLEAKSEVGQMPAEMTKEAVHIQIGKKPQ
jgi:hypothetical protein